MTSYKSRLILALSLTLGGILVVFLLITFIISAVAVAQNSNLKNELAMLKEESGLLNASLFSFLENRIDLIEDTISRQLKYYPASSCAALPHFYPSGYYWVGSSNDSAVRVYCDMTLSCDNIIVRHVLRLRGKTLESVWQQA